MFYNKHSYVPVDIFSPPAPNILNFDSIRGEEFSVLGVKDKMAVWQQKTANSLPAGGGSEAHASENKNIILEADIAKSKSIQPPESPRVMGIASRNQSIADFVPDLFHFGIHGGCFACDGACMTHSTKYRVEHVSTSN
jgi:hypothetical protein